MGTFWELKGNNGNLMKTQPPTLKKKKKKKKNIPWGHVGATQLTVLTCFILRFLFRNKLLRRTGAGFRV
jgi:hypothetical protein